MSIRKVGSWGDIDSSDGAFEGVILNRSDESLVAAGGLSMLNSNLGRLARLVACLLLVLAPGCSKKSTGSSRTSEEVFWGSASEGQEYLLDLSGSTVDPEVLTGGRGRARLSVFGDTLRYRIDLTNTAGVTSVDMKTNLGANCPLYGSPAVVLFQSSGTGMVNGTLVDSFVVADHYWIQNEMLPFTWSCVYVHTASNPSAELAGWVTQGIGEISAQLSYNAGARTLAYRLTAGSINGVTSVTIHAGGVSQTGVLIATLYAGPRTGEIWADTILANGTLTDADLESGYTLASLRDLMVSSLAYVELRTVRYPDGTQRGQIAKAP